MRLWQFILLAVSTVVGIGELPVNADLLRMANGTQRVGRIVAHDTNCLYVMIDAQGIRSLVKISRSELYYIVPTGTADPFTGQLAPAQSSPQITLLSDVSSESDKPAEPATGSTSIILKGPPPATTQATTKKTPLAPASPEFLTQLGRLMAGKGGDLGDPSLLSPENRKYWDALIAADAAGDKRASLEQMTALAKAFERQPARLNLLATRAKQMQFSVWMAQTRWDVWNLPPRRPVFDVSGVTEIERTELIHIMRSKTPEAIEPLKTYFPPERTRAGPSTSAPTVLAPSAPLTPASNPLNGITIANTLEVRDKALLASAILTAQLKMEPDMPSIDRLFLAEQARHVQAIVARTSQLLPAAMAAKEKAEREKRLADEKAARQQR